MLDLQVAMLLSQFGKIHLIDRFEFDAIDLYQQTYILETDQFDFYPIMQIDIHKKRKAVYLELEQACFRRNNIIFLITQHNLPGLGISEQEVLNSTDLFTRIISRNSQRLQQEIPRIVERVTPLFERDGIYFVHANSSLSDYLSCVLRLRGQHYLPLTLGDGKFEPLVKDYMPLRQEKWNAIIEYFTGS